MTNNPVVIILPSSIQKKNLTSLLLRELEPQRFRLKEVFRLQVTARLLTAAAAERPPSAIMFDFLPELKIHQTPPCFFFWVPVFSSLRLQGDAVNV